MSRLQMVKTENIDRAGLSDGDYVGIENSVRSLVGIDLRTEPGTIRANQKLKLDNGAFAITSRIVKVLHCSDGNVYNFLSNGKIIKRYTNDGHYAEVKDIGMSLLNAEEYEGYIYYFSPSYAGRWQIGADWSTAISNYLTFKNANNTDHPSKIINRVLYIGDGNLIVSIESYTSDSVMNLTTAERTALPSPEDGLIVYDLTTSTLWEYKNSSGWVNLASTTYIVYKNSALDIDKEQIAKSLGKYNYELLVGSRTTNSVSRTKVYRWNTWSVSFTTEDEIKQDEINCFLETTDNTIAQAGRQGELYYFDGNTLRLYKKLFGDYSNGKGMTVYDNAKANLNNVSLFGVSNKSGNPVKQGIYSYGRYDQDYDLILALEYVLSIGQVSNVQITAMEKFGSNMLVAWEYYNTENLTTTYGIDIIDTANKYNGAYIETRKISVQREALSSLGVHYIPYKELPAGCGLNIYLNKNNAGYSETPVVLINDEKRQILYSEVEVGECVNLQVKYELVCSGNSTPIFEGFYIERKT